MSLTLLALNLKKKKKPSNFKYTPKNLSILLIDKPKFIDIAKTEAITFCKQDWDWVLWFIAMALLLLVIYLLLHWKKCAFGVTSQDSCWRYKNWGELRLILNQESPLGLFDLAQRHLSFSDNEILLRRRSLI